MRLSTITILSACTSAANAYLYEDEQDELNALFRRDFENDDWELETRDADLTAVDDSFGFSNIVGRSPQPTGAQTPSTAQQPKVPMGSSPNKGIQTAEVKNQPLMEGKKDVTKKTEVQIKRDTIYARVDQAIHTYIEKYKNKRVLCRSGEYGQDNPAHTEAWEISELQLKANKEDSDSYYFRFGSPTRAEDASLGVYYSKHYHKYFQDRRNLHYGSVETTDNVTSARSCIIKFMFPRAKPLPDSVKWTTVEEAKKKGYYLEI